jgi:hypothetical protein
VVEKRHWNYGNGMFFPRFVLGDELTKLLGRFPSRQLGWY